MVRTPSTFSLEPRPTTVGQWGSWRWRRGAWPSLEQLALAPGHRFLDVGSGVSWITEDAVPDRLAPTSITDLFSKLNSNRLLLFPSQFLYFYDLPRFHVGSEPSLGPGHRTTGRGPAASSKPFPASVQDLYQPLRCSIRHHPRVGRSQLALFVESTACLGPPHPTNGSPFTPFRGLGRGEG